MTEPHPQAHGLDPIASPAPLPARLVQASASGRSLVMGILNVTPDSFSDGGRWATTDAATAHGLELVAAGADIIDVGGESTRPGSRRLDAAEETARVLDTVRALVAEGVCVSVDTVHADTAAAVIEAGALIINDVSGGLADPAMHPLVATTGTVYVCQHWRGTPATMDTLTDYTAHGDVVDGVLTELRARLDSLEAAGASLEQVAIDPGLGFAKTHDQSWQLLAATARLRDELGLPVLVGASRKRFLAAAQAPHTPGAPEPTPADRDAVTAATSALASLAGAWALRVHDVPSTVDAVRTVSLWKEHR